MNTSSPGIRVRFWTLHIKRPDFYRAAELTQSQLSNTISFLRATVRFIVQQNLHVEFRFWSKSRKLQHYFLTSTSLCHLLFNRLLLMHQIHCQITILSVSSVNLGICTSLLHEGEVVFFFFYHDLNLIKQRTKWDEWPLNSKGKKTH